MPIYPPRNHPAKKRQIFEKRISELKTSKELNKAEEIISSNAKKVRTAKLNLIKAKLNLLKSYRDEDTSAEKLKSINNLEEEAKKWQAIDYEQILKEVL